MRGDKEVQRWYREVVMSVSMRAFQTYIGPMCNNVKDKNGKNFRLGQCLRISINFPILMISDTLKKTGLHEYRNRLVEKSRTKSSYKKLLWKTRHI